MALSRAKCQGDRRGYHAGSVRIAIVTDYYYPHLGGITEHVHGQATELTRRGHEVTIVTGNVMRPPPIVDGEIRPEANVPFEIVRVGRALPGYGNASQTYHVVDPLLRSKLKRIFERRKVDVVHVHSPYSPILPMVGVLAAPKSAVTVGTFHSVFPRSFGFDIAAPFMRRVIGRLDGKIVVSEACIGSLAPYLPYAYTVIPNGIDDRHFSPEADPIPELRDGKLNILFLGRFDPRNGLDTMIGAFTEVRRQVGPEVRLIVVGDGPLKSRYQGQVPADIAPDGAARGDELRATGRREPHLRVPAADGARPPGAPDLARRERFALRRCADAPDRASRGARADGARGTAHRRHRVRVVEGRRPA